MVNALSSSSRDCRPLSLCCKRVRNENTERLLRGDGTGYSSTEETSSSPTHPILIQRQKGTDGDKDTTTPGNTPTRDISVTAPKN